MNMLIVLIKELVESIYRSFRLLKDKDKNKNIPGLEGLKKEGMTFECNFYTAKECKELRTKIDNYIAVDAKNVWKDDADNRLYFINEIDSDLNRFYTHPKVRKMLSAYTGTTNPSGMLLAARIDAKEGNLGSGGGWHRDSPITHQFKAICYLSDVTSDNGPFQYIKSSHRKSNVLKAYFLGLFKAGQYRFDQHEIDNYLEKTGQKVTEFIASEGAIAFADTKGIHRGKPIIEGKRYALFCYFWHGKIPMHFEKLRQK